MHKANSILRAGSGLRADPRHLMDVIAAVDVTAREKLAILQAWEADERAESEGMGGGED